MNINSCDSSSYNIVNMPCIVILSYVLNALYFYYYYYPFIVLMILCVTGRRRQL